MSSRLTRAALARDAAYARMIAAQTPEELCDAKRALLDADARWREELDRRAARKTPVAA